MHRSIGAAPVCSTHHVCGRGPSPQTTRAIRKILMFRWISLTSIKRLQSQFGSLMAGSTFCGSVTFAAELLLDSEPVPPFRRAIDRLLWINRTLTRTMRVQLQPHNLLSTWSSRECCILVNILNTCSSIPSSPCFRRGKTIHECASREKV